jgi:hypothetical protein
MLFLQILRRGNLGQSDSDLMTIADDLGPDLHHP